MEKDSSKIAYELKCYVNAAFETEVCLTFPKFWNPIIIKGDLCKSHSCKCLCKICMKKLILPMLKLQISFWSIFDSFTELLRQNYFFYCFDRSSRFQMFLKISQYSQGNTCVESFLKLVSAIFYEIFIFSPNDSPLKTMKNVGLFSKIKKGSGARFWCTFSA